MVKSYPEVLESDMDYLKAAQMIIDQLRKQDSGIQDLIESVAESAKVPDSFIRTACEAMIKKDILSKYGERLKEVYKLINRNDKEVDEVVIEIFADGQDIPEVTKAYFRDYGFSELVRSVARQVNHNDIIIREYNEDRLWLGRFVDFLDKAKEWLAFHKADQAIAKQKIKKLEQQSKTNG